jgi:hypothetical protein
MKIKILIISVVTFLIPSVVFALPPGVVYDGPVYSTALPRGKLQNLFFQFATTWVQCDDTIFDNIFDPDVRFRFPGPFGVVDGLADAKAQVGDFCASFENTSVFFPDDGFLIDVLDGTIAAEVQFRSTRISSGVNEVVNDVWIARAKFINNKWVMVSMKEYLDGRVSRLQGQGVLQSELGEDNPFLAPWPPFVEGKEDCVPITAYTCGP